MKARRLLSVVALTLWSATAVTLTAADFDWIKDFNIKAEADLTAFKARLAARFKIGDVQINAVLSKVDKPADAYVALRLGEMASKPTDVVLERYRVDKDKGWGVLAKSLGIKPGSKEFHALKRGDDLYSGTGQGADDKGKGRGKGKGKK